MSDHIDTKRDSAYLGGYLDALKDRDKQEAEKAACTCDDGDDRMTVLTCPVHGPTRSGVRTSNGVWTTSQESGIPITVTQPDDPAYALLMDPNVFSTPVVHKRGCYICEDPEFAQMGLPLCRKCEICGGHIAADDCVCDDCGFDAYDAHMWEQEPAFTTSPFLDLSVDECWP